MEESCTDIHREERGDTNCGVDGVLAERAGAKWLILLSETGLRTLQHNNFLLPAFLKEAKLLGKGKWNLSRSVQLISSGITIPVYQFNIKDIFQVVWQVDVVYLHTLNSYSQIIKVWDITDHDGVQEKIKWITMIQKTYALEHLKACQMKYMDSSNRVLPMIFPSTSPGLAVFNTVFQYDINDEQDIVTTLKFVPLSTKLLWCIQFGVKGELPYLLSKEEYEVIEEPGSVLLLGRSGTGKTTSLVFRLHKVYKGLFSNTSAASDHWQQHSIQEKQQSIHQIFVTMSPILCERIRKYFLKMKVAMEVSLEDGESVKAALKSVHMMTLQETGNCLLEEEDEENMFSSIPDDFTILKDAHFPMFITYGKLLSMLRGTISSNMNTQQNHQAANACGSLDDFSEIDDEEREASTPTTSSGIHKTLQCLSDREVTYDLFERWYWPKFDKKNTRYFNPVLVWSEIMSLIKGSELALENGHGCLTAQQYLNCSFRRFPTFRYNREQLYCIFEQYEKIKRQSCHVDLMDKVSLIYNLMIAQGYGGVPVHEIYCDEVQDLSISQLKLLHLICKNPKGFFFAGDTAQTIARGSAFRFEEVSAMMYHTHKEQVPKEEYGILEMCPLAPRRLQLTDNYRTHGGILRVASSVIVLIENYFKGSIDLLKPDHPLLDGPRPIFLEGSTFASLSKNLFGAEYLRDDSIEFGADQVILVRNQEAKKIVQKTLTAGLVLTIYEAKGLEFNDVLIFNFFNDSPAQLKWRVFLGFTQEHRCSAPKFDEIKHTILCSELKHLYTAITRARKQLWFFDSSLENRLPILEYWNMHKLIQVQSKPKIFAHKSTPKEWSHKGTMLFEQRLYKEAQLCFRKASEDEKVRLCEANIQRQEAAACIDTDDTARARKLYHQSAELFKALGKYKAAAQALLSGDYCFEAGEILREMGDYEGASKAFVKAKEYCYAAECMEALQNYSEAIRLYKEGRHLEKAINKLQHPEYLAKVHQNILNKTVKMYCLPLLKQVHCSHDKDAEVHLAIDKALSLLPSSQAKEKFLIDHGYINLIQFFCNKKESSGSKTYIAEAEIYSKYGQKWKAADLYLKAAQALAMEWTHSINQQETQNLIELSMECLVEDIRVQIAAMQLVKLPFEILEQRKTDEDKMENCQITEHDCHKKEVKMFLDAECFIQEAIGTYSKYKGFTDSNHKAHNCVIFKYSEKLDLAILEVREQNAQLNGNVTDLQSLLVTYSSHGQYWLDAQFRVLLILCNAFKERKLVLEWDRWTDLQSQLMQIYKLLKSALTNQRTKREQLYYLKCCERLFQAKHLDENFYLIAEDRMNIGIIKLLEQWQAEAHAEVITDETSLNSATNMWRCLKPTSLKAMGIILGMWVYDILHYGADLATRRGNVLKEPCEAYANLSVCQHQENCALIHAMPTSENHREYLTRLTKQSNFAQFQGNLGKHLHKANQNEVKSAMGLSRFWLEKLQQKLQIISPFCTSTYVMSEIVQTQEMPREALIQLISHAWLDKEYAYQPSDITRVLQTFYILVQLGFNYIPSYCKWFTRPIQTGRFPQPVWLIHDYRQGITWSQHSNLFNILKHAKEGDAWQLVQKGKRYLEFLVMHGHKMMCTEPWIILWLLDVTVGVTIAMKNSFHGILLPSSIIHGFFNNQKALCKGIMHGSFTTNYSYMLNRFCDLAMQIWDQNIWPLQTDDQWFAGSIRIQTTLVLCSYHLNPKYLEKIWSCLQKVRTELSKGPTHNGFLRSLNANSLDDYRTVFVDMLNSTLDPVIAICANGRETIPWFSAGINNIYEMDSYGSMKKIDHTLYKTESQQILDDASTGESNETSDQPQIQEEDDMSGVNEVEATVLQQETAVRTLQLWVRRIQLAKSRAQSRDNVWDGKFDQACVVSSRWSSRRYRMLYLGCILPTVYNLYRVNQAIDASTRTIRRKMTEAECSAEEDNLEKLLDEEELLRLLKLEVERCLSTLDVHNQRHTDGDRVYLREAYRNAVRAFRKSQLNSSLKINCM